MTSNGKFKTSGTLQVSTLASVASSKMEPLPLLLSLILNTTNLYMKTINMSNSYNLTSQGSWPFGNYHPPYTCSKSFNKPIPNTGLSSLWLTGTALSINLTVGMHACHLGVVLNIPTIGCAKTFFDIDGLHQHEVEDMLSDTLAQFKQHIKLKGKSGKQWCTAILTDPNQNHHLYVSVGTKISLGTATHIVMKYLKNQTPEPVFKADRNSRKKIKQMSNEHYQNAPSYEMKFLAP